jgi:hypothetical protein
MYQTIAVAVIVLMAGAFLKKRISFLQKFCIPAPVIGGLLLDFAQKKRNCKSTKAHNSPLFRSNYTITELPLSNEKALPKRSASLHLNVLLIEN